MATPETPTQAIVDEALDAAVTNGYDLRTWTETDIVDDMLQFCAPVEDSDANTIGPLVRDWMRRHPPVT